MTLENLITSANLGPLDRDLILSLSVQLGISLHDLCDQFARKVATDYLAGDLSWQVADSAMNQLHAWAYGPDDVCLPEFAKRVFLAFDEGEYFHQGDPPGFDPELYTTLQIKALLGGRNA